MSCNVSIPSIEAHITLLHLSSKDRTNEHKKHNECVDYFFENSFVLPDSVPDDLVEFPGEMDIEIPSRSPSHSVIRRSPSGRKPSMPGAYPRGSYSSEDSSLVTSNPSSPGSHDHESLRSDSSSVKSSSKSLKGPMKGLSRAGSFAERFWNRGKKKKSVNGGRSQVFELLNVFVSDTVIFRR